MTDNVKPLKGKTPIQGAIISGGENQPVKMDARRAVAVMSQGFLEAMKFVQLHGTPKDVIAEAMRIGQIHGCCKQENGIHANGQIFMHYTNPYAQYLDPAGPTKEQQKAGEAAEDKKAEDKSNG